MKFHSVPLLISQTKGKVTLLQSFCFLSSSFLLVQLHSNTVLSIQTHYESNRVQVQQIIVTETCICSSMGKGRRTRKHLRCIILDKAIAQSLFSLWINRHPEAILLDEANLAIDFSYDTFKLLKLLLWNNREIVHHYNVPKPSIKLQILLLENIIIITAIFKNK